MNPLKSLITVGQSVWLDYIRRNLLTSGELERLLQEDGLRGMTSNPAIFEKAIAGSTDYEASILELSARSMSTKEIYEHLAIKDIQDAADALKKVYQESNYLDGYVSLEVSPRLAHNTEGTLEEARRLWKAVNRPNLMIKVPGTLEGVPVIKRLISEGINVNVTLLFSQEYYEKSAQAYLEGLEERANKGLDISHISGVASFFISRIDSLVDKLVAEKKQKAEGNLLALLGNLEGHIAIANAKLTYQSFKKLYASERWQKLEVKGAKKQRLLWASTSTKNPKYRDVMYVEELIGKETVNTIPPATFDAFREHGKVVPTLEKGLEEAQDDMQDLEKVGISFKVVTEELLREGIDLFVQAFDKLLQAIDSKKTQLALESKSTQKDICVPQQERAAIEAELELWSGENRVHRLWARDSSLWTGEDESQWLGWLDVVEGELSQADQLANLAQDILAEGYKHVVVLGMGGSSLCPWMLRNTFGKIAGFPELHVLDSTDPAQVKAIEKAIEISKTLFVVSSKSGGTLEPNIFKQYFFDLTQKAVGKEKAGRHFVAVTDPGKKLENIAQGGNFRAIFHGVPSIGGRYSALSNFGMVPAALMGIHVGHFLDKAEEMVHACAASVLPEDNPGVRLGAFLGTLHNRGKDKVTLIVSPAIASLGAWLEQLLAESTGKQGKGLIPVDGERLGAPGVYGKDRVFVYVRLDSEADAAQDAAVNQLEKQGHSIFRTHLSDIHHLGGECFRWEIATAVAGSIIGINAFNQPDVEASKVETRKITNEYEKTGSLPEMVPIFRDSHYRLFTDNKNAADLKRSLSSGSSLTDYMKAHLSRLHEGDYFCLSAYIEMSDVHEQLLEEMRLVVRDTKKVATCLGFGPRFLHSTGQAYKGGPNSGVFLQITCEDGEDLPIPDQKYTFGIVKEAQARGDFEVLAERGRRALRIHLGKDVEAGLKELLQVIKVISE